MDARYDAYSAADPTFYDTPLRMPAEKSGRGGKDFTVARRTPPEGWVRCQRADWVLVTPQILDFPDQGWKIHVSAHPGNVDEILELVWDYCTSHGLPFKYLVGRHIFFLRNMKYADRSASGKLITIYTTSDAQLRLVLRELGAMLGGLEGPYILSDLRWENGPLYVRYGGFAERYTTSADGRGRELAIKDHSGRLVPDHRLPVFRLPDWVQMPDFLVSMLAARNATTFDSVRWRPTKALHFSNGGGVYLASNIDGSQQVVLKEARPHAGLAQDGSDAVSRLHRERDMLLRLHGVTGVPAVLDSFTVGEHHFVAEDFVPGRSLLEEFKERYPLFTLQREPQGMASYTGWVLAVCHAVERIVADIHQRGVVIGDLHMSNIMVGPDDKISLIDFELASPVEEQRRRSMGNPGFSARPHVVGFAHDQYALACLRLALFLPLTPLLHHDVTKAHALAAEIKTLFPVPASFLDEAVERIVSINSPDTPGLAATCDVLGDEIPWSHRTDDWAALRQSLVTAITASATPDREDRLYPGDIQQFLTPGGGLNLAYGAAGVLYALAATGAPRPPGHEQWLIDRALRGTHRAGPGFLDGLHGIAYVLDYLGHHDDALTLLDRCLTMDTSALGVDLLGGLPGIGLTLGHFAGRSGDTSLREATLRTAEQVVDLVSARLNSNPADLIPGLVYETAGCALFLMRMYEHTADETYLDVSAKLLDFDLRQHLVADTGTYTFAGGQGRRLYLSSGAPGTALMLSRYLTHRHNDRFRHAANQILSAVASSYHTHAGLFTGRAGVICLQAHARTTGDLGTGLREQIRALGLHQLTYAHGVAFPGEHLVRLSMDLATGSAGVLLALGAALQPGTATWPLFNPAPRWPTHDQTCRAVDTPHAGAAASHSKPLIPTTNERR